MPTFDEARSLLGAARSVRRRWSRRLGDEEAGELAAEAVFRAVARPCPDGRVAPWLERIAHNLVIDRWRRRDFGRRRLPHLPAPAPEASPEDRLLEAERCRALGEALGRMPEPLRQALVARFVDEAPYADVAARLGLAEATVRARVHRGLLALREQLARLRALVPAWPSSTVAVAVLQPVALLMVMATATTPPAGITPPPAAALAAQPRRPVATRVAQSGIRSVPRTDRYADPPAVRTRRAAPTDAGIRVAPEPPVTPPPAVQRIDIDADGAIEGDLDEPTGEFISGLAPSLHASLIEIRDDFTSEIGKSLEDI